MIRYPAALRGRPYAPDQSARPTPDAVEGQNRQIGRKRRRNLRRTEARPQCPMKPAAPPPVVEIAHHDGRRVPAVVKNFQEHRDLPSVLARSKPEMRRQDPQSPARQIDRCVDQTPRFAAFDRDIVRDLADDRPAAGKNMPVTARRIRNGNRLHDVAVAQSTDMLDAVENPITTIPALYFLQGNDVWRQGFQRSQGALWIMGSASAEIRMDVPGHHPQRQSTDLIACAGAEAAASMPGARASERPRPQSRVPGAAYSGGRVAPKDDADDRRAPS